MSRHCAKQYVGSRLKNPELRTKGRTMKNRSRVSNVGRINNCYVPSCVLSFLKNFLCSLSLLFSLTAFHALMPFFNQEEPTSFCIMHCHYTLLLSVYYLPKGQLV